MSFSYPQAPQAPQGPPPGQYPYHQPYYGPPPGAPGWPPSGMPAPGHPGAPAPANKGITESLALLAMVLILHVLANAWWLVRDHHLIHLDEAHHMKRSMAYYDALFEGPQRTGLERFMAALDIESPYPPLSHLLGAASMRLLGYSADAVAATGTAALAMLLVGVYLLALQGMSARNAFLAALTTSLIPMIYAGSRYFMPEVLLCALVVWALFALLKSDRFRKAGWVVLYAILAGLALLTKQSAFIYLFIPTALMLLWGCIEASRAPREARRSQWNKLLFHGILFLVLTAGLSSWWYIRHAEYQLAWWNARPATTTPILHPDISGPFSFLLPTPSSAAEGSIVFDPDISEMVSSTEKTAVPDAPVPLQPKPRDWYAYPIYMVNQVLFLPLAALALLGLPTILLKRNRTPLFLMIIAWLGGAWLMLTGLFALESPRFLYCAAPPAAFLCVYALDAIPKLRLRRFCWTMLGMTLLFQFFNLTFMAAGPVATVELPLLPDQPAIARRGNTGLVLHSASIPCGNYTLHAPKRETPISEIIFASLEKAEQSRRTKDGAAAWYQVISPKPSRLGLDFYEKMRQYANSHQGTPVESNGTNTGTRPLTAIKAESRQQEDTLPELAETDYIVLKFPSTEENINTQEENVAFFYTHGFKSSMNCPFPGYGKSHPGDIHLMVRKEMPPLAEIANVFDLYDLLEQDGARYILTDDERMAAEQQYAKKIQTYTYIQPLNNQVNLVGVHVEPTTANWYVIRLIVHIVEPVGPDYTVFLRATAHPEEQSTLLPQHRTDTPIDWDFAPAPPSESWQRNQALILSRPTKAHSGRYRFEIGIYKKGESDTPVMTVETDWVAFAPVP